MMAQQTVLAAQDSEDLEVISARLQDAVAQVKDLAYLPKSRRFAALFNRFRWEAKDDTRIRCGLVFEGVTGVQASGIRRDAPAAVVSLLAIRFTPRGGDDPGGAVEMVFSGGGALRLEVECLDVVLSDSGAPYAALGRPAHKDA